MQAGKKTQAGLQPAAALPPGDAVLLVSRDAEVARPLARSQDELSGCVKRLLPSFVGRLAGNTQKETVDSDIGRQIFVLGAGSIGRDNTQHC